MRCWTLLHSWIWICYKRKYLVFEACWYRVNYHLLRGKGLVYEILNKLKEVWNGRIKFSTGISWASLYKIYRWWREGNVRGFSKNIIFSLAKTRKLVWLFEYGTFHYTGSDLIINLFLVYRFHDTSSYKIKVTSVCYMKKLKIYFSRVFYIYLTRIKIEIIVLNMKNLTTFERKQIDFIH